MEVEVVVWQRLAPKNEYDDSDYFSDDDDDDDDTSTSSITIIGRINVTVLFGHAYNSFTIISEITNIV